MKITIETTSAQEIEALMELLHRLNIKNVTVVEQQQMEESLDSSISKGDKSIDPSKLFGIWKNNPRNIDEIRNDSWDRNWN